MADTISLPALDPLMPLTRAIFQEWSRDISPDRGHRAAEVMRFLNTILHQWNDAREDTLRDCYRQLKEWDDLYPVKPKPATQEETNG